MGFIGANKVDIVNITRRSLLKSAGTLPLMLAAPQITRTVADTTADKVDYTLRIATGLVELSPEHVVSTTLYNGPHIAERHRWAGRVLRVHGDLSW